MDIHLQKLLALLVQFLVWGIFFFLFSEALVSAQEFLECCSQALFRRITPNIRKITVHRLLEASGVLRETRDWFGLEETLKLISF